MQGLPLCCFAIGSAYKTRVPKNTYPVRTEHALSAEYCTCSSNCTAVAGVQFCTAHICLASLSNCSRRLSLKFHPLHTCINNIIAVVAQELKV